MDLKFVALIKTFVPKGKFWENQEKFNLLIDGISDEFSRAYNKSKKFYEEFNIISSEALAGEHSQDYLIIQGLYTNRELQRIIVEYLNKDLGLKAIIVDFANFLNVNLIWGTAITPLEFGVFEFADEFGDANASPVMELFIEFDNDITCQEYNKIVWLVSYLKPPYLKVTYTNKPVNAIVPFTFGYSQFSDEFGELIPC